LHSLTKLGSTSKIFAIGMFVYLFPVFGSTFGFCGLLHSFIFIDYALQIYYSTFVLLSKLLGGASNSLILSNIFELEVSLNILNKNKRIFNNKYFA